METVDPDWIDQILLQNFQLALQQQREVYILCLQSYVITELLIVNVGTPLHKCMNSN